MAQLCDCGWDFRKQRNNPKAATSLEASRPTSYHQWLRQLNAHPLALGVRGWSLVFASVPATLVFAVLGLTLFPPGWYPRLVLALPGIMAGCILSYGIGFLVYKLQKALGSTLCGVVGAVGVWLVWLWARAYRIWP
jgi:hypothetical protein